MAGFLNILLAGFSLDINSPRTQGRKSAIDEKTMAKIEAKINQTPDVTLLELIDKFKLKVTESALSKKLKKQGYSFKKRQLIRQSKTVPTSKKSANNS